MLFVFIFLCLMLRQSWECAAAVEGGGVSGCWSFTLGQRKVVRVSLTTHQTSSSFKMGLLLFFFETVFSGTTNCWSNFFGCRLLVGKLCL